MTLSTIGFTKAARALSRQPTELAIFAVEMDAVRGDANLVTGSPATAILSRRLRGPAVTSASRPSVHLVRTRRG
jgi:hypothetical protein